MQHLLANKYLELFGIDWHLIGSLYYEFKALILQLVRLTVLQGVIRPLIGTQHPITDSAGRTLCTGSCFANMKYLLNILQTRVIIQVPIVNEVMVVLSEDAAAAYGGGEVDPAA